jgi:hypothetical protein
MLVIFRSILFILRRNGIFYGHLVQLVVIRYIFPFWYVAPIKIWQPLMSDRFTAPCYGDADRQGGQIRWMLAYWAIVDFRHFLKLKSGPNLRLLFNRVKFHISIFDENELGYILGDFFTDSSGHPANRGRFGNKKMRCHRGPVCCLGRKKLFFHKSEECHENRFHGFRVTRWACE